MKNELIVLENATRMLAEVRDAVGAKKLMDMAAAAEHYAKKAKLGEEAVRYAFEIKVDAETLLGEFLERADKHKGGRPGKTGTPGAPVSEVQTLVELGLTKRQSAEAQLLAKLKRKMPGVLKDIRAGRTPIKQARREFARAEKGSQELVASQKVLALARQRLESVCDLQVCTMQALLAKTKGIDAIITDPPYPEEFLPLYGDLARLAQSVPLVAVMCGQTYLPRLLDDMCKYLSYRWTLAYFTPGAQLRQWNARIDCGWKPVLLFGQPTEYVYDVVKSEQSEKAHHDWQQSQGGFDRLIEVLTKPGQLVCDPFLGAGTTALAALKQGRKFIGCDIEEGCVLKTWQRLAALKL